MTYLVLARKYRPRSFDTLIGQDHVVRALTHALDTQRLHHAWLFTGTRGVGKTTLSRILAKSLNCETGITSRPCGVCSACCDIDAGRFVDYVELDAASNRGVDEMTQLLEQAVYAPSVGRFKVYMIDEVHMLTGHAFNAMLKTLEEPPAHVKFIIATTDPQKIPVTVLSRCLQFNLKQMPPDAIVGHLGQVLTEEQVPYESPALRLIAQAAGGSMRDALSLTDQAIAYSAGSVTEQAVRGMLGTIDQRHLVRLLQALGEGNASAVIEVADELSMRGLSYSGALADLSSLLSRVAIARRVPDALDPTDPLAGDIVALAAALHPDTVQLFYTIAVHSRQELALAPDEYAGFVMACLRMLALVSDAGPVTMPELPVQVPVVTAPAALATTQVDTTASTALAAAPVGLPASAAPADSSVPSVSAESAPTRASVSFDQPVQADPGAQVGHAVLPPASVAQSAPSSEHSTPSLTEPAAEPVQRHDAAASVPQSASSASPPWDTDVATPSVPVDVPAGVATVTVDATTTAPQSDSVPSPPLPETSVASVTPQASEQSAVDVTPQKDASVADSAQLAKVSQADASSQDNGPPDWVSESIPDDAFFATESSFSVDPDDDEFETLADQVPAEPVLVGRPIATPAAPRSGKRTRLPKIGDMTASAWPALAAILPVTGLAAEVARQSEWLGAADGTIRLRVAVRTLADSASRIRLQTVLCEHFGHSVRIDVIVGATGEATAHAVAQSVRAANQLTAEQAVEVDEFVMALKADFGAHVVPKSIRYVEQGVRP